MPAINFDIKKGDTITSINGLPAKNISLEDWLNISDQSGMRIRAHREHLMSLIVNTQWR